MREIETCDHCDRELVEETEWHSDGSVSRVMRCPARWDDDHPEWL
jgi:hypothetical protein